ncbi:MAG TPA: Gfo/Idh/MocA family oxidoreductase [Planctomycetota bacterium]|nr:Gfo/Idh/MocA family oxidoreductase [Planctomycetota bacterium]
MKRLRCAMVGVGAIGRPMLRMLLSQPWFEAAALVDPREEVRSALQKEFSVPGERLFSDFETALARGGLDAALINTPAELHAPQSEAALKAGLDVLVAKPMTTDYESAVRLVARARDLGRKLCVAQQIRYNRHYTAVRRFLATGQIGKVEHVIFMNSKPRPDPLNLKNMAQPALYEMSCHHFDSLLSLFPDRNPEVISCDGSRPSWSRYAGPCTVNGTLTFSENLHVVYHCGFSAQADCYELRLEGERGALRCRGYHMSDDRMTYEVAGASRKWEPAAIDKDVPLADPFLPFFGEWHAYLSGGKEPPFSGQANLKVLAALFAGEESVNAKGHPVRIADNPRFQSAFGVRS